MGNGVKIRNGALVNTEDKRMVEIQIKEWRRHTQEVLLVLDFKHYSSSVG